MNLPPLLPYRVSFLTARLLLPPELAGVAVATAKLVEHAIFSALVRHPGLAFTDPFDWEDADADGRLWSIDHPEIDTKLSWELGQGRRDEVLWFELGLQETADPICTLMARRRTDPNPQAFPAPFGAALSVRIQQAIDVWLEARELGPCPRSLGYFTGPDLVTATRRVAEVFSLREGDPAAIEKIVLERTDGGLKVPFLRVIGPVIRSALRTDPEAFVLSQAAADPEARRHDYLARRTRGEAGPGDLAALLDEAPCWGKLWISLQGSGFDHAAALDAQGRATALMPTNPWATHNYSVQLAVAGRYEEAYRLATRCTGASPRFVRGHIAAIRALRDTQRMGEAAGEAVDRYEWLQGCSQRGELRSHDEPGLAEVGMLCAQTMLDIGRLDRALEIGGQVASGVPEMERLLPWWHAELERWRNEPDVVGLAYGREAAHRRDPGRVLHGYSWALPARSGDTRNLINALIASGQAELAPLAFAHFDGVGRARAWPALLAGARAHLLAGELAPGVRLLLAARLRTPDSRLDNAIHHLLRLAATLPVDDWEDLIRDLRARGALSMARIVARDAADFVPGMARSVALLQALGEPRAKAWDPTWLDALREAFRPTQMARVDAFFASHGTPTLEAADRMAASWRQHVDPPQAGDPSHARQVGYLFTQALTRYLAATVGGANPLASGYRQVASEALVALGRMRRQLGWEWVRPMLEALEQVSFADAWLFDRWLLRVERALDLEAWLGEMLATSTSSLPAVAGRLRGDERVGAELRHAHEVLDAGGDADVARRLLERCFNAYGTGNPAWEWSDVAEACLSPEEALDVHQVAAAANPTHAVAWLNLATRLLDAGRRTLAFEALLEAFPPTGQEWREARLAELRPSWERHGMDVPFEWGPAHARGLLLLEAGDTAGALKHLRWCDAIDPGNETTKRHVARAWARIGRADEALRAFAAADLAAAPQLTADALREAGFLTDALRVSRYASIWYTKVAQWLALGRLAWSMEDDEVGVAAFEQAFELAGGRLTLDDLNKLSTCLHGSGRDERAEVVARQMLANAGANPIAVAYASHAMARALIGQERFAEAVPHAERAAGAIGDTADTAGFNATLQRARASEAYRERIPRDETQEGAAQKLLNDGAFGGAMQAAAVGPRTWTLWRIHHAASEHRSRDDNSRWVTDAARHAAQATLGPTTGATDPLAVLCRIEALRILKDTWLPADPPPELGTTMSPGQLQAEWTRRKENKPRLHRRRILQTEDWDSLSATQRARAEDAEFVEAELVEVVEEGEPELFPGQPLPRLTDYVRLMRGLQADEVEAALQDAGLSLETYPAAAERWGKALAGDAALAKRFEELMA